MYKLIKSNKILLFVVFTVSIVTIFFITNSNKNKIFSLSSDIKKNETLNPEQKNCLDKTDIIFSKMNKLNSQLDYSLAINNSILVGVLGSEYDYITYKNNNCYALVQNYNPQISEYRYSIMNLDTQVLETVLLDHDLNNPDLKLGLQYREEFIEKYRSLFSNK